jgi:DNA-binding FrmR family transcriptional regulator
MRADKNKITRLLKTAKGQVEGIMKMVEEDRYCIDISNQIMAAESLLRKTNQEIIYAHMTQCMKEAFRSGNEDERIKELLEILDKISK